MFSFLPLGYKVHLVRLGSCATGYVPPKALVYGQEAPKSVVLSYDGDDSEHKVVAVRHHD